MRHFRHSPFCILHSAFCIALALTALCVMSAGCASTPPDKDYFSVQLPYYRGMVSEARRTPEVHLGAAFGKAETNAVAGRTLSVTVRDPQGRKVLDYAGTFGDGKALAFDAPLTADAPVGEYKVKAVTTDAEGRKVRADGVFKVVPVRKGQVFVDQDGGLIADGKPWFPFGFYHVLVTNDVDAIADLGIDLMQTWRGYIERPGMVDRLRSRGVRVAVETAAWGQVVNNFYGRWKRKIPPVIPFETNENFRAFADLLISNPDIVAFHYTADECGFAEIPGVKRIRDYWHALDEDHPTYLVTTRDYRMHDGADIFGVDTYPRAFGRKRPMTDVSGLVDHVTSNTPYGQCVIAVPQGFGHSGKSNKAPHIHNESREEQFCMSYLAMVHGAKGLFWYTWWDGNDQGAVFDAELRQTIKQIIDEAREFKLALLVPDAVTFRSEDGKVHARLCGDASTGRFLITVNGSDDPSDGVFKNAALKGQKLEPLFDTPAAQPDKNGQMKVAFKGAARAVWRVAPDGTR